MLHIEHRIDIKESVVVGHAGKLLFGTIGIAKTPAVLMSGRTQ